MSIYEKSASRTDFTIGREAAQKKEVMKEDRLDYERI